ncbi:MAG: (Fe-S)-binding protein [Dehalococcoidales bacterium]|jgi:Fe-S oxidoreductase
MALEDYRTEMETCRRCSPCKFIPFEKVTQFENVNVCPSITRYEFHTYCGGGRMVMGTALLEKRLDYTPKLLEVVYNCQVCGACDTSCKYSMDMEVTEPIEEIRISCVESGHTNPALDKAVNNMRKLGTMVPGAKTKRGDWAAGLGIKDATKEKVDVLYFVGCQTSYNKNMWKIAQATAKLLQKAGVNFGILGEHETCCGGRAYQMGYKQDFLDQTKKNLDLIKKSGAKTIITSCSEGYHTFKVLYEKFNLKGDLEVYHITEYLARLIKEGKLKPQKKLDMTVTYHDPCHLGRMGEPYIHWNGKIVIDEIRTFDPPKEYRRGTYGIYEPPRDILKSIPGLRLVEMDRIKEYAWCCGAGGGVSDSNPDFSMWTALERIKEAEATGADAIATACPWCVKNFNEAIAKKGSNLKVYDVIELLEKAF